MTDVHELVAANLYPSEDAVIRDALRVLLRSRPDLRIGLAIHRYQTEALSLAAAASLAGVSWPQMREILRERGIAPALGPQTLADVDDEIAALRRALGSST